ncbi:Fumarate reductase (quinol) [Lactiplantibacillus plantarum subsp. plantarum]|uniref:Fumarate reductase (Quinol) n=1 Tax=Lactiplantibacillus plantarum subsp. plantarum TaxID=337330 RepID=A0A2S3U8Z5_LACPN|nr:Fumarate reductase (quinol) [Lactiplantibacillus plantarum subsp. plantarum]
MTHTVSPFPTIEKDLQDAINEGAAVKEQTLAQIANTLNFDYNTIQQTVLEYNQIINSGFDF